MAKSVKTFGDYLRHFVRSVDIVDERTFDEIRQLVYDYVRDELEATYFSLACDQTVDGRPGLRTTWSTANEEHATTIRTPTGNYSSQISVSFDQRKPLWIVNPQQKSLRHSDEYVDLWSGVSDLPMYQAPVNRDMKTSIIIPLVHWSRNIGVIYLESTAYLEITEVAKDELSLLTDALAILFDLRQANRTQVTGTRDAITELQAILRTAEFPRLTKPQMFVAFSERADDGVMGIIQEVLNEFSDKLSIIQWNRIEQSGSITLQMIRHIAKSRFGLCYFSEPARDEQGFEDNPNVLFEAGMLHSLTNAPSGNPSGWIPVRERQSPRIPFDFASERVQIIPRNNDGDIMEERLRSELRRRVRGLLSSADSD
jgi:hypothetical protein